MEYNYKLISTTRMKNQWVVSDKFVIGLVCYDKPCKREVPTAHKFDEVPSQNHLAIRVVVHQAYILVNISQIFRHKIKYSNFCGFKLLCI